jgi:hypothetical protein
MAYNSTSWTTDANTKASSSGTTTMGGVTLYAHFGIGSGMAQNYAANTHIALPFAFNSNAQTDNATIGTGTDPDTSLTTADGANTDASVFVPCMWYIPDNISIDSVYSIEGANTATGDTTRMHLMSYTFTSGSTSCLTSGTLLAHNSDVTNAGSEQAYLSTWTIDSASVASGKIILATFRADSVNSDYSVSVFCKYHLT